MKLKVLQRGKVIRAELYQRERDKLDEVLELLNTIARVTQCKVAQAAIGPLEAFRDEHQPKKDSALFDKDDSNELSPV